MKVVFTLDIGNYEPQITELTYPLMQSYARKINAHFCILNERRFPGWPVSYEKMQIFERGTDWNLFFDADTLIHPDTIDFTVHMKRDTVYHNSSDMAHLRWKYDEYFLRDGRNIGSGNWLAFASDWCCDLWKPLEISLEEALENIHPTQEELNGGLTRDHFIDGYTVSRNIAKYGLKFDTIENLLKELGMGDERFFWHGYNMTSEQKLLQMKSVLQGWGL